MRKGITPLGTRWCMKKQNLTENVQKKQGTHCPYEVCGVLTSWFTEDMNRAVLHPWVHRENHDQLKKKPLNIYSSPLFHSFSDSGSWDKLSRTDVHGWLSWHINQNVLDCLTFGPTAAISQHHLPWWGLSDETLLKDIWQSGKIYLPSSVCLCWNDHISYWKTYRRFPVYSRLLMAPQPPKTALHIWHLCSLWVQRQYMSHLKVLSVSSHMIQPQTQWRFVHVFSLLFTAQPCLPVCHNHSILSVMTWRWIIDSCRRLTGYVISEPVKLQTELQSVLRVQTEMLQQLVDVSCLCV